MATADSKRGATRDAIRAFADSIDDWKEDSRVSVVIQQSPKSDSTPPLLRAATRGIWDHWRLIVSLLAASGIGWAGRAAAKLAHWLP